MRILHVNDTSSHVGGAETNIFSIIEAFKEEGHEQYLFALRGDREDRENVFVLGEERVGEQSLLGKATFDFFEPNIYFNRRVYAALRRHAGEVNPDVVHLHNNFLYANSILLALRKSRKPVVQSTHDYGVICPTAWCVKRNGEECEGGFGLKCLKEGCLWTKRFIREYIPRKISCGLKEKTVSRFICPSRGIQEKLSVNGFENTVHIPYFVFPDRFKPDPGRIVNGFILYVGVLFPQKGVDYLIDAMPAILEKKPGASLHIVGEGPEEESLKKKTKVLGLEDKIVFYGRVKKEDLPGFYSKANVVAVPSIWMEQFGIVGLEAMASGRPVVGSDIGGIPEWLSDGKTGLLARPKDSHDLADKIIRMLGNKKIVIEIGVEGVRLCRENFSAKVVYPKLLEVYESAAR